jgi:hypothetical protein
LHRGTTFVWRRRKPYSLSRGDKRSSKQSVTPLIVSGERGGRRVVWCGFDLRETDLPLRVAFPIFITNVLHWLTAPRGAAGTQEGTPLRAGQPVPLNVPAGTKEIIVTAPDESRQRVPVQTTPVLYSGADQVGVYSAEANDKSGWKKPLPSIYLIQVKAT